MKNWMAITILLSWIAQFAACSGAEYSAGWNQTIEQAHADPAIQAQVASKSSVFYKAGTNLFVPYYQQSAGINVIEALLWKNKQSNSDAATTALEIAYKEVLGCSAPESTGCRLCDRLVSYGG